jgi:cyclophilin family peptidyl-prolyl cis-trans isomerase
MPTATTPAPAPISESAAPEPAPSVPVPPPSPENPGSMAAAAAPANSNPDLSSTMASPAASDGAPMTDASPATADSLPGSPGSTADAAADVSQGPVVVVNTAMGQIVIELDDFAAPRTCKNFRELIADGFYNNTVFHRVIPDFIIQGGDPNSKSSAMDRNTYGLGSPGYTLPAEIRLKHDRGAVAMARLPDSVNPNRESNGSQFYICLQACPSLDDQYTVFGHVIRGLDVAEKIAEQPRDPRDNPLKRVEMTVSLEPRDQAMANTANSSGAAGEP